MSTNDHFFGVILITALFVSTSFTVQAQDTNERRAIYDNAGLVVSVSYHKVPWARVDSLLQLESNYNAITEKGRELG